MSTEPNVTDQPTVALTPYQQTAVGVIAEIEKIVAAIPNLEAGIPPAMVKFVRGHLNVPTEFLATALASLEQSEALQGTKLFDVTATRDILQYLEAFKPVLDKVWSLGDTLAFTLWSKKAAGAASAYRIYGMSKQIALMGGGNTATASHVSNMKRDLGRSGRKKKAQTQPTPAPGGPGHAAGATRDLASARS
jgi:hypothetical protein